MAKKATAKQVATKIIREFKDLNRAEIKKWRQAITAAQDVDAPKNYMLQDMYDNLESDGHYISQIGLRKASTSGCAFSIIDKKTGDDLPEKTELFNSEWFYNFMDYALDSLFKGYTLLELTNPEVMEWTLIPRRNVIGRKHIVLLEVGNDEGIDISAGFENTMIHIGKAEGMGLMMHLCGLLIWKRNAQQSWAEFTERFGMPLISATTNKTSQADIDRIDKMLSALGESATAVLPEGTNIDIKPFTGGDSYKVFDAQIERINEEVSKPLTGGTMVTDDGSSRSQSEVHERNLDAKLSLADKRMIEFVVNDQLLRIMQFWGWDVNPETDKFQFDVAFELSLLEHWNIVQGVMDNYEVEMEWLSKRFNIPIVGKKTTTQPDDKSKEEKEGDDTKASLSASFR